MKSHNPHVEEQLIHKDVFCFYGWELTKTTKPHGSPTQSNYSHSQINLQAYNATCSTLVETINPMQFDSKRTEGQNIDRDLVNAYISADK
jgi:hypothetical protein